MITKIRIMPEFSLMGGSDASPMLVTTDERGNIKGEAISPAALADILKVLADDVGKRAVREGWHAPIPVSDPRSAKVVWAEEKERQAKAPPRNADFNDPMR